MADKNLFVKIWDDIKSKPENHTVLIGTVISVVVGLCAWQYCRGYFKALGINISYAHIDNLIFAFEQLTRLVKGKSDYNSVGLFIVLLVLGIVFANSIWKFKPHYPRVRDWVVKFFPKNIRLKYWCSVIGFLFLFFISVCLLTSAISSFLAKLLICLTLLFSFYLFCIELWNESTEIRSWRLLLYLMLILGPINIFYKLGRFDGERVTKSEYRYLDTICLSKPAQEFEPTPTSGFQNCGKLLYADSQQFCIKERNVTHPICRHREKYEATIIPNDP